MTVDRVVFDGGCLLCVPWTWVGRTQDGDTDDDRLEEKEDFDDTSNDTCVDTYR